MTLLSVDGLPYRKKEGECAHPACPAVMDLSLDTPPPGWATLTYNRYGKKGGYDHATFCICPAHTINFISRQPTLTSKSRKTLVRTIIESPFAGNVARNLRYLRAAMRHSLTVMNESPYASHALYTQDGVLDDNSQDERALGMEAGFKWGEASQKVVVYTDLGVTDGMQKGIDRHIENGKIVEQRKLPGWDKFAL